MGISRQEARDSLRSSDLIGIGMEADAVRRRLHPENVVSYAIEGRLRCERDGKMLAEAADELLEQGASGISLHGAETLGLEGMEDLVRKLRRKRSEVWISGLTVAEARRLAAAGCVGDTLMRLYDAGLDSISAEGPNLSDAEEIAEWVEVHEAAHRAGMRTAATMRVGVAEGVEQRLDFLESVRELQERTGGVAAFVAASAGGGVEGPTAVECLKVLAVSRLMLDRVENLQVGWMASGLKVLEIGLRFGANDAGDVPADSGAEEDVRRVIRDAGFRPAERDAGYRMMFAG